MHRCKASVSFQAVRRKYLGMRRTYRYAAVTKDEDNAADGRFPTASYRARKNSGLRGTPPFRASSMRFTAVALSLGSLALMGR
jgi:hypothetical protein